MSRRVERKLRLPVPHGMDALLTVLPQIIRQKGVVSLTLNTSPPSFEYTQALPEGVTEAPPLQPELESIAPLALLSVQTLFVELTPKQPGILHLVDTLHRCATDMLAPLAWLVSPTTRLWRWLERAGYPWAVHDDLLGLPVLLDEQVAVEAIYLAAGITPSAPLSGAQRSYITQMLEPHP